MDMADMADMDLVDMDIVVLGNRSDMPSVLVHILFNFCFDPKSLANMFTKYPDINIIGFVQLLVHKPYMPLKHF